MAKRKNPLVPEQSPREPMLEPRPIRRGSLSVRYIRCSKPGCRCASGGDARHGPYYSLTRRVGGKTVSRWLSEAQAQIVRRQLAEGDRFRHEVDGFWEVCEALADAELAVAKEASQGEVEKGGSSRQSKRSSRAKSKSS
jgi:hypothetical protein